jgi:hypothetical protein
MTEPRPTSDELAARLRETGVSGKQLEEAVQALRRQHQTTPMVEKLRNVVTRIARDKGGMFLFALCSPGEGMPSWDVVVSAQWLREDSRADLDYVAKRISRALSPDEMASLARIVTLSPEEPFVRAVTASFGVPAGGSHHVLKSVLEGILVEEMWILCSQRPGTPKRDNSGENGGGKVPG